MHCKNITNAGSFRETDEMLPSFMDATLQASVNREAMRNEEERALCEEWVSQLEAQYSILEGELSKPLDHSLHSPGSDALRGQGASRKEIPPSPNCHREFLSRWLPPNEACVGSVDAHGRTSHLDVTQAFQSGHLGGGEMSEMVAPLEETETDRMAAAPHHAQVLARTAKVLPTVAVSWNRSAFTPPISPTDFGQGSGRQSGIPEQPASIQTADGRTSQGALSIISSEPQPHDPPRGTVQVSRGAPVATASASAGKDAVQASPKGRAWQLRRQRPDSYRP